MHDRAFSGGEACRAGQKPNQITRVEKFEVFEGLRPSSVHQRPKGRMAPSTDVVGNENCTYFCGSSCPDNFYNVRLSDVYVPN
jgi:hypothetical protein